MVQKAQWPIWGTIRLIILGLGFNSHQNFGQWLKCLSNLNLSVLLSRNLGKTEISSSMCNIGIRVSVNGRNSKFSTV